MFEERIHKINGQLEDLKEERREKTELFISKVQSIITDKIKEFSNRQCFKMLRNLVDDFEALENDQDSYEEILCKKRKALIKKQSLGEDKKTCVCCNTETTDPIVVAGGVMCKDCWT